ncbi:hypothetical protein QJS83_09965 [Bdellovibrio sp. 22V]|uniref:hypothetical protein n=1 Tax=Bdellovibrio sp. 22V TaxID=3044166 RepID=UPI00254296BB|nr:hypothetical protein [Bdellovibrio sp. 22V]WII70785.1 hypothetical protein QJS83_09965 [Bdellovibrio sp. 22V]
MKYISLFLFILFPQFSLADAFCTNMQLQIAQTNVNFNSGATVNPTIIVKANTNPGPCDFFITVNYGSSTTFTNRSLKMGSNSWPFQLTKNPSATQILKNFPDVSGNNDVLTGYLVGGSSDQQVVVNYWAAINQTNPWLMYGNYTESITFTLYKGTLSSYSLAQSGTVTFNYNAPKRVDISVAATGGNFNINDTTETLNFGSMSSGISRSADIILKYNAGYILFASSLNNSRLKHTAQNLYIPYTISFRGTPVNLGSSSTNAVQVARELGRSPASGLVIPVTATIGSTASAQGGTYQDTIVLTVQSAE